MATKVSCSWICKGWDKLISATGPHTPMNQLGSLHLKAMDGTVGKFETLDGKAIECHFGSRPLQKNLLG